MEQKPIYTDITWLGSKISQFPGSKVLNGLRQYIIESDSYQAVNIKVDEYKSLLPLPFPRFFTPQFTSEGLLSRKPEFIERMSTLTATYQTGDLSSTIWLNADLVKWMPITSKMHLKNEGYMEDDDFIDMNEWLENMFEAYEMFNDNRKEEEWDSDE